MAKRGKTELALILPHLNTDRQSREGEGEESMWRWRRRKREDKSEKREAGRGGGYGELKSERGMGCVVGKARLAHLVR